MRKVALLGMVAGAAAQALASAAWAAPDFVIVNHERGIFALCVNLLPGNNESNSDIAPDAEEFESGVACDSGPMTGEATMSSTALAANPLSASSSSASAITDDTGKKGVSRGLFSLEFSLARARYVEILGHLAAEQTPCCVSNASLTLSDGSGAVLLLDEVSTFDGSPIQRAVNFAANLGPGSYLLEVQQVSFSGLGSTFQPASGAASFEFTLTTGEPIPALPRSWGLVLGLLLVAAIGLRAPPGRWCPSSQST